MRSALAAAVAIAIVAAVSACGGDEGALTGDQRPRVLEQVCFKGEMLQTHGGKGLASTTEATLPAGRRPVDHAELKRIVRLAFEPTLRGNELSRLRRSDGDPEPVIAAAEDALAEVRARPEILLEQAAITRTFAESQELAERGGYSQPDCGESNREEVESVNFRSEAGTKVREIFSKGSLTITAACRRVGGQPMLSVAATTETDNASISSEYDQGGAPAGGHRFELADFDRDYGPWDLLGSETDEARGRLVYESADGRRVTVDFIADRRPAKADCKLRGTATQSPGE